MESRTEKTERTAAAAREIGRREETDRAGREACREYATDTMAMARGRTCSICSSIWERRLSRTRWVFCSAT